MVSNSFVVAMVSLVVLLGYSPSLPDYHDYATPDDLGSLD